MVRRLFLPLHLDGKKHLNILWIFCPFEHCVLRTPYCVLRNHADIIHLAVINMVTDYTQYEVRSTQCSNGQKIHSTPITLPVLNYITGTASE